MHWCVINYDRLLEDIPKDIILDLTICNNPKWKDHHDSHGWESVTYPVSVNVSSFAWLGTTIAYCDNKESLNDFLYNFS